jgi:Na+-driven multidrug efflux pump
VLGLALAVLLYAFRHWIASRFTEDASVIEAAMLYLALVPISYGPGGVIAIANAAFNGLNRPFSAVIVSVSRTLLVNVPVAWIGGRLFGVPGIFLGICFSNLLVGVVSGLWVLSVTTPAKSLKPCTVS